MIINLLTSSNPIRPSAKLWCHLVLLIIIWPKSVSGADIQQLYFVRFDVISVNNMISESKLEMLPAENEFRIGDFTRICVTGQASNLTKHDKVLSAKHNAISTLLILYGLKSIHSRHKTLSTISNDVVIMRYEGLIKYPITIISQGYDADQSTYMVEAECIFSPIPFPDKWSALYLKNRVKHIIRDVWLLFGF